MLCSVFPLSFVYFQPLCLCTFPHCTFHPIFCCVYCVAIILCLSPIPLFVYIPSCFPSHSTSCYPSPFVNYHLPSACHSCPFSPQPSISILFHHTLFISIISPPLLLPPAKYPLWFHLPIYFLISFNSTHHSFIFIPLSLFLRQICFYFYFYFMSFLPHFLQYRHSDHTDKKNLSVFVSLSEFLFFSFFLSIFSFSTFQLSRACTLHGFDQVLVVGF